MNFHKVKTEFQKLPLSPKLIIIGSLLTLFGTLLPWYQDQDPFGGAEIFYGVTGPLYLIGIFIFLMSAATAVSAISEKLYHKPLKLPVKNSQLWLIFGAQSVLLLVTAVSIYYHPKFGLDIYIKQTKFGLFLSFIGTIMYTYGAYQNAKTAEKSASGETAVPVAPIFDRRTHTPVKTFQPKAEAKKDQHSEEENLVLDL